MPCPSHPAPHTPAADAANTGAGSDPRSKGMPHTDAALYGEASPIDTALLQQPLACNAAPGGFDRLHNLLEALAVGVEEE